MIREWTADVFEMLGRFCLWRSRAWTRRSELMADVSEWLATPATWSEIRDRNCDREAA